MSEKRFRFTKAALDRLPLPPEGGRAEYRDTEVNGLIVRVTSNGVKTFGVFRRVKSADGKPVRVTIGRYPDLSFENARNEARKILGQVAAGEHPREKAKLDRQKLTLGELFDQFMSTYAVHHRKSRKGDQWLFDAYLGGWRDRRLVNFTSSEIEALQAKLRDKGPVAANRAIAFLSLLFQYAMRHGLFKGENPAKVVKPFVERPRERRLLRSETPAFFAALEQEPNRNFADFVLIALWTGARRGNVLVPRHRGSDRFEVHRFPR